MSAERDYLQSHVFARIERECIRRGVQFTPIDLRWGITADEATSGQVVRICLEEIERCAPYFIGFIGERYGWVPRPEDIGNFMELYEEFPLFESPHVQELSVTEMEMLHGALNRQNEVKAAFFLRSEELTQRLSLKGDPTDFYDADHASSIRLKTLKNTLKASGLSVERYEEIETFGQQIERVLIAMLEADFPLQDHSDEIAKQSALHDNRAQLLQRFYLSPDSISALAQTERQMGGQLTFIQGATGLGKSAALTSLAAELKSEHHHTILHYASLDERPSPQLFVKRICELICTQLELNEEASDSMDELTDLLFDLFEAWHFGSEDHLTLLIDDIDLWRDGEWGSALQWLPPELPRGLSMIASISDHSWLNILEEGWAHIPLKHLELQPLTNDELLSFSERYLGSYRKRLSHDQLLVLSHSPLFHSPQALKIMLAELKSYGSFEGLDDLIQRGVQAPDVMSLCALHLEGQEAAFGRHHVQALYTVLFCAQAGLNEPDLAAYLGCSQLELSQLSLSSSEHIEGLGGSLSLSHPSIRETISRRYQITPSQLNAERARLANWLGKRPASFERTVHQLKLYQALDDQHSLLKLLCDLDRVEHVLGTREWLTFWRWSGRSSELGALYEQSFKGYGVELPTLEALCMAYEEGHDKLMTQPSEQPQALVIIAGQLSGPISDFEDHERGLRLQLWAHLNHNALTYENDEDHRRSLISQSLSLAMLFSRAGLDEQSIKAYQVIRSEAQGRYRGVYLEATHNLALTLKFFGRYEQVESLLMEAVKGYTDLYSPENPTTLTASQTLASYYHEIGRFQQALSLSEEVLALLRRRQGSAHDGTLAMMNNFALIYSDAGHHDQAIELLQECYEGMCELYGEGHPKSLQALSNLANTQSSSGEQIESYELAKRILEEREQSLGPEHLDTLTSLYNVALIIKEEGEYEEAEQMLKRVCEGRASQLGTLHAETLTAQHVYAEILEELGEDERAQTLRLEVLEKRRTTLGEEHPDTLQSYTVQGIVHAMNEELDEAYEIFKRVYEVRLKTLGLAHDSTLEAIANLALCLASRDEEEEAISLMRESLTKLFEGNDPPAMSSNLQSQLLELYVEREDEEAWQFADLFLKRHERCEIPCSPEYFEVWSEVINHLAQLDEEEAASFAERWARNKRTDLEEDPMRLGDLCKALSETMQELDEDERALPYHLELITIASQVYGAESDEVQRVQFALGQLYETLDEREQSEQIYRQLYLALKEDVRADKEFFAEVMSTLGQLLFELYPEEKEERRSLFKKVEQMKRSAEEEQGYELALIQAHLGWEQLIDGSFKEAQGLFRLVRESDELDELCELGLVDDWELIWCQLGDALVSLSLGLKKKRKPLLRKVRKLYQALEEELGDEHPRCIAIQCLLP